RSSVSRARAGSRYWRSLLLPMIRPTNGRAVGFVMVVSSGAAAVADGGTSVIATLRAPPQRGGVLELEAALEVPGAQVGAEGNREDRWGRPAVAARWTRANHTRALARDGAQVSWHLRHAVRGRPTFRHILPIGPR